MAELRMYCIFSQEALDLMENEPGKEDSMAGHAYLHAYWNAESRFPEAAKLYRYSQSAVKITVVTQLSDDLEAIQRQFLGTCGTSLVVDEGRTVFGKPTVVCLGLGPLTKEQAGEVGKLKLRKGPKR